MGSLLRDLKAPGRTRSRPTVAMHSAALTVNTMTSAMGGPTDLIMSAVGVPVTAQAVTPPQAVLPAENTATGMVTTSVGPSVLQTVQQVPQQKLAQNQKNSSNSKGQNS